MPKLPQREISRLRSTDLNI